MLEKAVYQLLSGLAFGRVYAQISPQSAATPFIIYQRVDSERWRSINAPSGIGQATIQVDAYSDSYYGARELSASIEAILDGYRGTVSYGGGSPQETQKICGISLQNDIDILDQTDEPFLHRVAARYLVTYEV